MDLAIKFSCEVQDRPAMSPATLTSWPALKRRHYHGTNFSFCDHSSGRHLYEQCAALDDRFDKIKREDKLAEITKILVAGEQTCIRGTCESCRPILH